MMNYTLGKGDYSDWIVSEVDFSADTLGKTESIMYLGNGYMGLRSATEEPYLKEVRNLFVAGTFNKMDEIEVSELPNLADVTRMDIRIDGQRFTLEQGTIKNYQKQLNLKTAELVRTFDWTSPTGKEVRFRFKRFVSLNQLHLIAIKVEVEALSEPLHITLTSGINAQMTNSGVQHFHEGERRIYDKRFLELIQTTTQSKIDVVFNTVHKIDVNGVELANEPRMEMDRRKVWLQFEADLQPGETMTLEKLTTVYTSRDKEWDHPEYELVRLREASLTALKSAYESGYDQLFVEHTHAWQTKVWNNYPIMIKSSESFDLLAMRFALYHLTAMTPAHDERFGAAAKALSGEGYKGHSFWDTEVFILPFFIYSNPEVAKSLLKYRYLGLEGARKKARENGFDGAMYPWEAAWPSDGEVTPVWGAVDIVTGEQTKIWSGFIEQHITSDITYAVWQYYKITNDQEFMDKYGYEMIFDTATFWASRLEWNAMKQEYHITDVVGPDEYKEHVDNNAFTNHMAHFNMELAIAYYDELQAINPKLHEQLSRKLGLEEASQAWKEKINKIYLPMPREEDLLVPQDDTYLSKKVIDLTKYKNQTKVGSMFLDYNLEQVNDIQVSKQADIMILFLMLENRFAPEVKIANFHYYEAKTLHDSSLSLSTHAILANDLGQTDLAYSLFQKATQIDLGPAMNTSDHGVHAASIGGIWQSVVQGFGGVRMIDGRLRVNPRLPKQWDELSFSIYYHGAKLSIHITKESITIHSDSNQAISLEIQGQQVQFLGQITQQYQH